MKFILQDASFTGVAASSWEAILQACCKFDYLEKVILFGSRAQGNYKNGSDIDLALVGKNITHEDLLTLSSRLNEELSLPYHFDLVDYGKIKHKELKEHIDQMGVLLFLR